MNNPISKGSEVVNTTGTSTATRWFVGNTEVFPCRCGEVHQGDYAVYDALHHECLHEVDLVDLGQGQVICPDCGMAWIAK